MKIPPETIAAKLAALKNLQTPAFADAVAKQPRQVELLWFLEWSFRQPGGAVRLIETMLDSFADCVGTDAMHRIGKTDELYTAAERQDVIASVPIPRNWHYNWRSSSMLREFSREMRGHEDDDDLGRPDLAFVNKQNHSYFYGFCRRCALAALPAILEDFCERPDATIGPVWYFHDLPGALIAIMDAHAARATQALAMTQVVADIFDALEFAIAEKSMVEIIGDSRFGKSIAIENFCAAHPGRARLVKTPCTNDQRSFFEAIADAAGLQAAPRTTGQELQRKLQFILQHSGLMFIFDESAWLFPQNYSPKTAPLPPQLCPESNPGKRLSRRPGQDASVCQQRGTSV